MKFMKSLAVLPVLAAISINAHAKIKIQEGSLDALKGQTEITLQYDYSSMGVGKYKKEADYVADKVEAYNKKEAGRGDQWAKAWVDDRENRFEPTFMQKFQETSDMKVVKNAKYTIIMKTTFIEPGYNIAISRKNASVDMEAWVVETANPGTVLCKIIVSDNPGRTYGGYDYDTGQRIAESYEYAGKYFGKFIKGELK